MTPAKEQRKRREVDPDAAVLEAAPEEPAQDPVDDDEAERARKREEALHWMQVAEGGAER